VSLTKRLGLAVGTHHGRSVVPPELDLLLRRCDAGLRFPRQRLGNLDDLRNTLVILVTADILETLKMILGGSPEGSNERALNEKTA
jgi:hypothetical protein